MPATTISTPNRMIIHIPPETAALFTMPELQIIAARFIQRLKVIGKLNNSGGNTREDAPPKESLTDGQHTTAVK